MSYVPVLGVPILNRPDLLDKMLDSIDVTVGQIIVVDNGGVVSDRPPTHVIRPGRNLGVAASWNLIIKSAPRAAWWFLPNFDVEFHPGDLARLAEHMDSVGGVALLPTFEAFALTSEAVERVGWFDENFHPAYFEDNDFDYRCRLSGVSLIGLPASTRHEASATIRSSSTFSLENARTYPANAAYYQRKWGGPQHQEVYTTPFNEGGDHRSWRLDISRLADQSWKKE